jgi:hypothetical protein
MLAMFESIFSANTKPVNQGPREDCLMKKTEGRKSRDTVPLKLYTYSTVIRLH